jgi:hypothetical protein
MMIQSPKSMFPMIVTAVLLTCSAVAVLAQNSAGSTVPGDSPAGT